MLMGLIGDNGVFPIILLFLFLFIAILHIPIIFYIGKESVLIIFDEATRRSYSKKHVAVKPIIQNQDVPKDTHRSMVSMNILETDLRVVAIEEENKSTTIRTDRTPDIEDAPSEVQEGVGEVQQSVSEYEVEIIKKSNHREYLHMHPWFYYSITTVAFVFVVIISIVVGDVTLFYGIIGSTVSFFMVFAGPGAYYVVSTHKKKLKFEGIFLVLKYLIAWWYIIFGVSWMICFNIWVILNFIF